jgi:hypothetical protein
MDCGAPLTMICIADLSLIWLLVCEQWKNYAVEKSYEIVTTIIGKYYSLISVNKIVIFKYST